MGQSVGKENSKPAYSQADIQYPEEVEYLKNIHYSTCDYYKPRDLKEQREFTAFTKNRDVILQRRERYANAISRISCLEFDATSQNTHVMRNDLQGFEEEEINKMSEQCQIVQNSKCHRQREYQQILSHDINVNDKHKLYADKLFDNKKKIKNNMNKKRKVINSEHHFDEKQKIAQKMNRIKQKVCKINRELDYIHAIDIINYESHKNSFEKSIPKEVTLLTVMKSMMDKKREPDQTYTSFFLEMESLSMNKLEDTDFVSLVLQNIDNCTLQILYSDGKGLTKAELFQILKLKDIAKISGKSSYSLLNELKRKKNLLNSFKIRQKL